ncbi:MAG TPA: DUF2062 domain-containing protein [Nitrospinota bacterium]|jgi:hypothetical protein|nr:DUF2062 domain-containing protein [Nitrospinota bacterium]|tara:strand:- start:833 stop:1270 length:438 start_codon:yes stop_codon:yes gene_type:complete
MISRKAIKNRFSQIVAIDEHPHRISLAFAIGIFISFSPVPGTQTISAMVMAWLLRLNVAVAITGTLFSNPFTLVVIYGSSICFGSFILGNIASCYPHSLGKNELFVFLKSMPAPLFTGTILLGAIAALISYFVLFQILMRYQKSK